MLPVRLVRGLFFIIGLILRPLVGNVFWSAPGWAPSTGAAIRRRPLHFAGGLLVALVLAAAGWFGWQRYQHRPKPIEPDRITLEVKAPAVTGYATQADNTPKITIHPLEVVFSHSAAPIELVGKPVSKGITMQPLLKGEWRWVDDHTLRFVPAEDWPVGGHVEVRFDTVQAFAPHILMALRIISILTCPGSRRNSVTASSIRTRRMRRPRKPSCR